MEKAPTLASEPEALGDDYDVLVVGSGYGGAITAARLGAANRASGGSLRIAILERGGEHPTGSFPDTEAGFFAGLRSLANPLGLYDILQFDAIDVLQGCGLGGTSLVNMNVAIVPDREVFLSSWPEAICAEVGAEPSGIGGLAEYYGRARGMLVPTPYAADEQLPKADLFGEIAENAGTTAEPLNITVSTEERTTRYGVRRRKCINCGDCVTGCNIGAKNTLMTNYLPMARHHGVELHTRLEVDTVEPAEGAWRVRCRQRGGPQGLMTTDRVLSARRVVLSAGSLGTTAILLRSQAEGLRLSPRLGMNFSGNGDNFGVAYNTDRVADAQGFGTDTGKRAQLKPGPNITSVMRFGADQRDLRKRYTVEDLALPRALVDTFRLGLMGLAALSRPGLSRAKLNRWRKDVSWNTDGALNHSIGFLVMAHDNSDGRIVLDSRGAPRVDWRAPRRSGSITRSTPPSSRPSRRWGATTSGTPAGAPGCWATT